MKKHIWLLSLILILVTSCYKSKNTYDRTIYLNKYIKCDCNLYVEIYKTGLLNVLQSDYLTDSVNFRIYIGKYDGENEMISYKCKGDSICVIRKKRFDLVNYIPKGDSLIVNKKRGVNSASKDTLKVINQETYTLERLKMEHPIK